MRGLMPTGTVARTVPKPTASTGLLGSQLGLVGRAAAEQSGMLMMLTEPAWTPSPALATTISYAVFCLKKNSELAHTTIDLVHLGVSTPAPAAWFYSLLTLPS